MARIRPINYEEATPEQRAAHDETVQRLGTMTDVKRTLLHSLPAFRAIMQWYNLLDAVQPFLGTRLTNLFSYAISEENRCLTCSIYLRRQLMESGEDLENFSMDEREQTVVDFGRCLAKPYGRVPDELYDRLAGQLTQEQIVALTAFGAMMVATNVVNNALELEPDSATTS